MGSRPVLRELLMDAGMLLNMPIVFDHASHIIVREMFFGFQNNIGIFGIQRVSLV
jgi:hypothetical protein